MCSNNNLSRKILFVPSFLEYMRLAETDGLFLLTFLVGTGWEERLDQNGQTGFDVWDLSAVDAPAFLVNPFLSTFLVRFEN